MLRHRIGRTTLVRYADDNGFLAGHSAVGALIREGLQQKGPDRMTWDAVRLMVGIWALPAALVVAVVVVVRLASRRRKRSARAETAEGT